jgi:hypothetical protein
MRKVFAAFANIGAVAARAETIDVSTIKCPEPGAMIKGEASYLMFWLCRHNGGEAGEKTIDLSAMESIGKAIGEKYAGNPELDSMTAINQLLAQ